MSMISKELQEQQDKDVGAAFKKIFGEDTPVIDAQKINDEERKSLERKAIERLNKQIDALSKG